MRHLSTEQTLYLLHILRPLSKEFESDLHDAAEVAAKIERPSRPVTNKRVQAWLDGRKVGRQLVNEPAETLRGLISGLEETGHSRLTAGEVRDE